MINAVLFDLDGTLLDTSEGIMKSVRYTIDALGYNPLPDETILKFVGPPIQNSLMLYLGLSKELAQKGADVFRNYYKTNALYDACLYPGIMNLLNLLKSKGKKIGVATYKREDYATDLLKHFKIADFCNVVHGADNNNKLTKADIIEMCVMEMNENKNNVVFVGDSEHDAKGAQGAGVSFVAVTWGFGYSKKDNKNTISYPCFKIISKPIELQFD